MENLSTTDLIAALALVTALVSLIWNIVRDMILDRVQIKFTAAVGGLEQVNGTTTALFADAGTQNIIFNIDKVLFRITNTGRRSVVIFRVEGKYVTPVEGDKFFTIAIGGLPCKVDPYEVYSTTIPLSDEFLSLVNTGNLDSLWVEDTAGKKWILNKVEWKRLSETAAIARSMRD